MWITSERGWVGVKLSTENVKLSTSYPQVIHKQRCEIRGVGMILAEGRKEGLIVDEISEF
jgi:hypothetical protein